MTVITGVMPTSKTALFTAGNGYGYEVTLLRVTNKAAVQRYLNLYHLVPAGTSRQICPYNLALDGGDTLEMDKEDGIVLPDGHAIEGIVDTGTDLEYVIHLVAKTEKSEER